MVFKWVLARKERKYCDQAVHIHASYTTQLNLLWSSYGFVKHFSGRDLCVCHCVVRVRDAFRAMGNCVLCC